MMGPMSTQVLAIAGIEAWPIDFRTPLVWFGLGFGVLAVVALVSFLVGSLRRRWTGHQVTCPIDGGPAHLFVERSGDGTAVDVALCSRMSPPGRVACGKDCLAHLARA